MDGYQTLLLIIGLIGVAVWLNEWKIGDGE